MQPLHKLNPGDTYANKSYIVRDNDGQSIGIKRIIDGWLLRFDNRDPSYNRLVKKDES